MPQIDIPDRPAWMPDWEALPGETLVLEHPSPNATSTINDWEKKTTLQGGLATNFIGDSAVPIWLKDDPNANVTATANANANAASSTVLNAIAGPTGGHLGFGGLGMVTVLLMVYNLASGLGLGIMLWKGIIDWKGNFIARFDDRTTGTGNNNRPVFITVTDDSDNDWFVPLTWVEGAVQRVATNSNAMWDAVVELTGTEGNTGRMRLETLVDGAVQTLRSRAAGLI